MPYIDYFCFQYERGESGGNLHLQGFLHFNKPMDMSTVHKLFPTCHLDAVYGTNRECIDYCSKSKTKVDGYDFVQHGNTPAEIGERTDIKALIQDVIDDLPYDEMLLKYPWHMLNMGDKIEKLRQNHLKNQFKNTAREVYVTYIYGAEGTGKTTFPYRVLGLQYADVFKVSQYKHSGNDFWDMMQALEDRFSPEWSGKLRFRISSMEPGQLGDRALAFFQQSRLVAPHLHLSLQSGSLSVLKRMGPGRRRRFFGTVARRLSDLCPRRGYPDRFSRRNRRRV